MSRLQLVLGGARSGKSSLAEQYAVASNLPVTYIATAQALDTEMIDRISRHQQQRPQHWRLIESPLMLADAIASIIKETCGVNQGGQCILVDCLTLWLSNCLCQKDKEYWQAQKQQLLTLLADIEQYKNVHIILVSNEVGHGIVPMGDLSREFVDQSGWLHQAIAELATGVEFVMAGLPLTLKAEQAVGLDDVLNESDRKEQ